MTLSELVSQSENWSEEKQKQFCNRLPHNLTICIRSIILNEESPEEKLKAIKYVNEFLHKITNINWRVNKENTNLIKLIAQDATYFANLNQTTANEIGAILNHTYNSMRYTD